MRRLLIIPARGNSKRIPMKNIKLFHKKPIINYVLSTAIESKLFNKIHVSTESTKVAKTVKKFGLKIDFLRPKNAFIAPESPNFLSRMHLGHMLVKNDFFQFFFFTFLESLEDSKMSGSNFM